MSHAISKGSFINNKFIKTEGDAIISYNPSRNYEPVFEAHASIDHVNDAVAAARKAYPHWSNLKQEERNQALLRLKKAFETHEDELARAITHEMGKVLSESKAEAKGLSERINLSIESALPRLATIRPKGAMGEERFHAQGPLAVIGPFNFPAHLINAQIIPALLTGNTLVVKPSEVCPQVGEIYAQCAQEADFMPGVFNLIHGNAKVSSHLVVHKDINGILFTGSYQTGRKIIEAVLDQPHKILALELGGKNFSVVMDDADLYQSLIEIVQAAFLTTGQKCTATSRVLVHRSIADKFIAELVAVTKNLKPGDPLKAETLFGPLATKHALERFLTLSVKAEGYCETLVAHKVFEGGAFVSPSIRFLDKKIEIHGYTDSELFGPDICVQIIDSIDDAIEIVNACDFGLSNAVFTRQQTVFEQFYRATRCGIVNWNRGTTGASGKLPFGGVGRSGNYRPAGIEAVRYTTYPVAVNEGYFGQTVPHKNLSSLIALCKENLEIDTAILIARHRAEELLERHRIAIEDVRGNAIVLQMIDGLEQALKDYVQIDSLAKRLLLKVPSIEKHPIFFAELKSFVASYADKNYLNVAGNRANALSIPHEGSLERSEAYFRRLYYMDFCPQEKKLAIVDLHSTSGSLLSSVDEKPLTIFDAASQIATIGIGFQAGEFLNALDKGDLVPAVVANPDTTLSTVGLDAINEFSSFLLNKAKGRVKHATFTDGGSLACEKAFDVCRMNGPGGKRIIAFEGSFHGRTIMSLQATYNKEKRGPFEFEGYKATFVPFPANTNPAHEPDVTDEWIALWSKGKIPEGYPQILPRPASRGEGWGEGRGENHEDDLLQREITSLIAVKNEIEKGDICAVIIEPMQCEGGDNYASARFFNGLRALTHAHNVPLIFDEIQTGFCLGGPFFWHQKFKLRNTQGKEDGPDCITLAKKAQLGVCLSAWPDSRKQSAHLVQVQRGLLQARAVADFDVASLENSVREYLKHFQRRFPDLIFNTRCSGFAFAFDVPNNHIANQLINQRFYRGFMVYIAGEKTLRFRLNMTSSVHLIEELFHNLTEAIHAMLSYCADNVPLLTIDSLNLFKAPAWMNQSEKMPANIRVRNGHLDFNSIHFETLTRASWANFEPEISKIEEETYEPTRRNSMEEFRTWLELEGTVALVLKGQDKVLGYAIGIPLEHAHVDGPTQDPMRGKNNTFYSANVALLKDVHGYKLGYALKKAQIEAVRALRNVDGSPRYCFMTGRNRLGFTKEIMNINAKLGAYQIAVYDNQYDIQGAQAAYYRLRLRYPTIQVSSNISQIASETIDWASSIQTPLGANPQEILDEVKHGAFTGAVGTKLTLSNWATPNIVRYSETLRAVLPQELQHTYFTSGRDEIVDKGLRCLRVSRPEAQIAIGFSGQYVGHTTAASRSLSDGRDMQQPFSWFDWPLIQHPSESSVEKSIKHLEELIAQQGAKNILGIVYELVGEKSGYVAKKEFLTALSDIRSKTGIPLIFVETASSFGRCSNSFFMSDDLDVKPNMIWWYPGAQLGHVFVDDKFYVSKPLTLISTWDGDEISVLRTQIHMRYFLENKLDAIKKHFTSSFENLCSKNKLNIGGDGLWRTISFADAKTCDAVINASKQNGLIVKKGLGNTIVLCPPINVTKDEITKGLDILAKVEEGIV